MIAMLKYSPVKSYSVYLPPKKLILANSTRGERLTKKLENYVCF